MLVKISEQCEASVFKRGRAVVVLPVETGDEIINQLGCRRVVADHDEARRDSNAGGAPQLVSLVIVTVEGLQRGLQLNGEAERIEGGCLAAALLGHPRANVLPEVSELRHIPAGYVVRH